MTGDELATWVRESRAKQGLPDRIVDAEAIEKVAELIVATIVKLGEAA